MNLKEGCVKVNWGLTLTLRDGRDLSVLDL